MIFKIAITMLILGQSYRFFKSDVYNEKDTFKVKLFTWFNSFILFQLTILSFCLFMIQAIYEQEAHDSFFETSTQINEIPLDKIDNKSYSLQKRESYGLLTVKNIYLLKPKNNEDISKINKSKENDSYLSYADRETDYSLSVKDSDEPAQVTEVITTYKLKDKPMNKTFFPISFQKWDKEYKELSEVYIYLPKSS